jgi:PknH-like extracellular domain
MAGTTQSCARPINRYQETPFIVTKKHRQFHIGVGGITAPFLHVPRNGGYRATLIGWARLQWEEHMHQPTAALAVAVTCVLIAGCSSTKGNAEATTTTRSMIPRPLVERELAGLLLSPEQVNAAMGAAGMTVTNTQTSMSDNSATMAPQECLAIDGAAEAPVYANSGYWAERDQSLNDGDNFTHYLKQAVVLFPLVEEAGAFFDASAQQWPACRQYTHTQSDSQWSVGQISNTNDTLTTTATQQNARAPGWGCGRALALRNNVIIDINTCSANPADSALKIADQIADNITARW